MSYQWIENSEASELNHVKHHAKVLNRALKNSLMDWGFADAVMALGPMEDLLSGGIRELLIKSLQSNVKEANPPAPKVDAEVFFVTHSLGSYLSLIALDTNFLGSDNLDLAGFQMTPEQKQAADYFSAHTAKFYFLAVSNSTEDDTGPCLSASEEKSVPGSIEHWLCKRDTYLSGQTSVAPIPQIIAWSDPNDLLSWEVPQINGVHVVNIRVRNSGFKLGPLFESPTGAHANYANSQVEGHLQRCGKAIDRPRTTLAHAADRETPAFAISQRASRKVEALFAELNLAGHGAEPETASTIPQR